ncbi:MAG TPA: hypothetical protein VIV66_20420, partial [Pyrinomonadaceae bacterium]
GGVGAINMSPLRGENPTCKHDANSLVRARLAEHDANSLVRARLAKHDAANSLVRARVGNGSSLR